MKFLLNLFLTFFVILFVSFQFVLAQDFEINLDAGEQIFTQNCAACHSGGNNVINPEKTLKIEALKLYNMNSIQAITNQVTNGNKAGMPAFGGRLSDEDIQNVANFVLNQANVGW
uniref:Cytochrome c-553 n=1 Tax=Bostrychia simpliciuscula TaxID=324754 RepID=A0A1Z1M885_9FLOR|nr:cytochrome c553 [Bostrychia simpliciuscula]ARW61995.1 cytochrome c553 [Bostrychia simpliciuscula]